MTHINICKLGELINDMITNADAFEYACCPSTLHEAEEILDILKPVHQALREAYAQVDTRFKAEEIL